MYKKTVIELSQQEILSIGQAHDIDHDHKQNAPTPSGIEMIFNGFYDEKRNKILKAVVSERIFKYLRDKGIITGEKIWSIRWIPSHHWGPFDEDGYGSSIYTLKAEVYQSHYIREE